MSRPTFLDEVRLALLDESAQDIMDPGQCFVLLVAVNDHVQGGRQVIPGDGDTQKGSEAFEDQWHRHASYDSE